MEKRGRIYSLYLELWEKYGPAEKYWPQWCARKKTPKTREIIAIGAILTQRTSWHNANLALKNLKKEGLLSLEKIAQLKDFDWLTELIRSAGFYQTKPKRLFDFCSFIVKEYGTLEKFRKENLTLAREKLLSLKGIGPETADTILLYALDKPTFVIDEYTKRFVKKYELAGKFTDDYLKDLFEKSLPKEAEIYQNYHVLIIVDQKGEAGSKMEIV